MKEENRWGREVALLSHVHRYTVRRHLVMPYLGELLGRHLSLSPTSLTLSFLFSLWKSLRLSSPSAPLSSCLNFDILICNINKANSAMD
jgi:hypothetical protein